MFYYYVLAMCDPIPTWRGYLADTTQRLAGTTIRYICYGRYAWYEPNDDNLEFKYRYGCTVYFLLQQL